MGEALTAAGELGLITAAIVAIGFVLLVELFVRGMLGPLTRLPYIGAGIITSAQNAILRELHKVIARLQQWIVKLYTGLTESLQLLIGSVLVAFLALFLLVKWLAEQAAGAVGGAAVARLQKQLDDEEKRRRAADAATASALAAEAAARAALAREVHATTAPALRALATETVPRLQARVTTLEQAIASVHTVNLQPLRTEVGHIEHDLGTLAAQVGTLRSEITVLEHPATPPAPTVIPAPIPTPIPAPIPAPIPGARGEPGAPGATGERGAPGEAAPAGGGTIDLPGLGTLTLAGAVALTYSAVQTIATEAGLDRAECRGKVKNICGTDPSEWLGLLEGAVLLTGALSLRELAPIGREAVHALGGVVREAA